jgi:hypothetical protein
MHTGFLRDYDLNEMLVLLAFLWAVLPRIISLVVVGPMGFEVYTSTNCFLRYYVDICLGCSSFTWYYASNLRYSRLFKAATLGTRLLWTGTSYYTGE